MTAYYQNGENSAETDAEDSNSDMNEYDFIQTEEQSDETTDEPDFETVGNLWTLGDHSSGADVTSEVQESIRKTIAELDDGIDGDVVDVLQDASEAVESTDVTRFECPHENCGLGHSHGDHKHDIRSGFSVTDSFAAQMEFVPYCHCGVNELSMLMAFMPYITEPVFDDQFRFEEVMEVEPTLLDEAYYRWKAENGENFHSMLSELAGEEGRAEEDAFPLGVRNAMASFFERRYEIECAADSAPIPQETQNVITEKRENLYSVIEE